MKKSEMYFTAAKAVIEANMPSDIKLEVLDMLLREKNIEKMFEDDEEKRGITE